MADELILISQTDAVRTLTLNRPQALNAFTTEMHAQLRDALDAAADDAGVRCVVVTGAGRGFCAGQDLSDPAIAPEPEAEPKDIGSLIERVYRPLALRIRAMPVPVIAAVNGVAAGAGANFALGCDIVVAARSASFIQAFSKIGLVPDCGGTWLLPRLVGRARALALSMTGDKLPATKPVLRVRGRARQGDAARIDPGFDTAARMLGHELRERLIETHAGGPLRNRQRSLLGPGRARAQVIIQSCHRRL